MSRAQLIVLILAVLTFSSCSEYQKILNSDDYSLKYKKANEYFEKEDYNRALPLYDELRRIYLGKEESEMTLYRLALCEFETKQLYLASYHFNQYFESFPYGDYAEKALYMHAMCLYELSPKHSLDQSSTAKAIRAFQLFTTRFPESENVDLCNKRIDELRKKVEIKAFENAALFHQIQDFKSAVWSLSNFVQDYPMSPFREKAEFLRLESSYELAMRSVRSKQEERLVEAIEYYQDFRMRYPKSPFLNDAKKFKLNAQEELNNLIEENG